MTHPARGAKKSPGGGSSRIARGPLDGRCAAIRGRAGGVAYPPFNLRDHGALIEWRQAPKQVNGAVAQSQSTMS
jgi:hypothetical protein